MRRRSIPVFAVALAATFAAVADEAAPRPRMEQLRTDGVADRPPSPRDLVDAREEVDRRFRDLLARADTAAGANAATATLLEAAATEQDRAVKWHLLAEARRLAAAAGNAAAVDRSIIMADAAYEFDAIAEEHRTLKGIPLRALEPARAATLAQVAEGLAERAAADDRSDVAADAWALAIRGWQRAGDVAAARRAAARLGEVERARLSP